jgi:predicted phosphodiesterase
MFNKEHLSCVDFIKKSVKESCAATKIVLTHHVPSPLVTAEEFKNSSINRAFVADLTEYIAQSDINYWIYGHSHRNVCKQIGNTQVLSNQLGYVSRQEFLHGFNPSAHISV